MDFLKEVVGDELFKQLSDKINEFNGNEANKDKQIKLENINSGNYVSKLKYEDLAAQLSGKDTELAAANGLIEDLKKGTKGDEELQGKVATYKTQAADLQKQLAETRMKSAIKIALLSEKAVDVDYLSFKLNEKLKEKGETLELDENEKIKGWDDKLAGLKTQFPSMFEKAASGDGYRRMDDGRLSGTDGEHGNTDPKDLAEALQQRYEATHNE